MKNVTSSKYNRDKQQSKNTIVQEKKEVGENYGEKKNPKFYIYWKNESNEGQIVAEKLEEYP